MTTMVRRPQCERTPPKVKYLDAAGANRSLAAQAVRARGGRIEPYECRSCGYFHLYTPKGTDQ